MYRRLIRTEAHKNKFVFRRNDGFLLLVLIPLVVFVTTILSESMSANFFWFISLLFLLAVFMLFNQRFVKLEHDIILFKDREVRIKGTDITKVLISSSEVIIDTLNYTFKRKSLRDKNWSEFQEAVADYASQFDHIKVERV